MIRQKRRTLYAGAGCAVVAGCLTLWAAGDAAQTMPSPPKLFAPQTLALPNPVDLAAYTATRARPLFSQTRRPDEAAESQQGRAAPEISADPLPVSRLVAVAIGPDRSAAIVQLAAGGSAVVMLGERIDDWVLTRIAADHVVLSRGMREAAVSLPAFAGAAQVSGRK